MSPNKGFSNLHKSKKFYLNRNTYGVPELLFKKTTGLKDFKYQNKTDILKKHESYTEITLSDENSLQAEEIFHPHNIQTGLDISRLTSNLKTEINLKQKHNKKEVDSNLNNKSSILLPITDEEVKSHYIYQNLISYLTSNQSFPQWKCNRKLNFNELYFMEKEKEKRMKMNQFHDILNVTKQQIILYPVQILPDSSEAVVRKDSGPSDSKSALKTNKDSNELITVKKIKKDKHVLLSLKEDLVSSSSLENIHERKEEDKERGFESHDENTGLTDVKITESSPKKKTTKCFNFFKIFKKDKKSVSFTTGEALVQLHVTSSSSPSLTSVAVSNEQVKRAEYFLCYFVPPNSALFWAR